MTKIPIHTIITHLNPDLDSMMCVLLLKYFGEELFEGVSKAGILFVSAGQLPDNKSPKQLEKEGFLAVDIGGGRFDSHPAEGSNQAKNDRSATDLVAEELGVMAYPEWVDLVEYTRLQDTRGHSLNSQKQEHHFISLQAILLGLALLYPNDSDKKMEIGLDIIQNIPFYVKNIENPFPVNIVKDILEEYVRSRHYDLEQPEPAYLFFANWIKSFRTNPKTAFPRNKMDRMVSLRAIILGAYYRTQNMEYIQTIANYCLDAVLKREAEWVAALEEYDAKCTVKNIDKLVFVSIEAANGLVMKAARFRHKPDILTYRNPENGATTVFIQRKGDLELFPFPHLAALIRLAEAVEMNEPIEYKNLNALGKHHGWFLHQSENLLIKGSIKEINFIPSKIALNHIDLLIYSLFDKSYQLKLPTKYTQAILKYNNPLFR